MLVRDCPAAALIAIFLSFGPGAVTSQPAEPVAAGTGFNDPDFWRIVGSGPRSSAELEKLITTYIANGSDEEAVRHFADYLLRESTDGDPFCNYCQSLMPASHRFAASQALNSFIAATDFIVDQAFDTGSANGLMRVAVIMSWSDVSEHRDRALYFLTAAAQLGIEDRWRDDVVQVLTTLGFHEAALTVAQSVYTDARSEHYGSDEIKQWVDYLEFEVERREPIGSYIANAAIVK